ncbi:aminopeptidase [Nocardiopsis tropica]
MTSNDPRWARLADHIASRLEIAPQSRVSIFVNDVSAAPAAHALIRAATRIGAAVQTVYTAEFADADALASRTVDELAEPAPVEVAAMEWSTVHVSLRAMLWPDSDADADPDLPAKLAAQRTAKGVVSSLRWRGTRWAVVRVPTAEWAAQIDVPFSALLDEFFAGALENWDAHRRTWQPLADAVTAADTITVTSPDTHLTLRVAGRLGVLFAGEANLPDGEVATAPLDDGVNGHITFPGTFVFAGHAFEDHRLEFTDGLVTAVDAARGADVARALIATDAGSARVGELGIGTSSVVQTWTGDLFLDEKILGTVHIALGRAYAECKGTNDSSLHWDIVKDLRPGAPGGAGTLAIDGRPVIVDGELIGF